MSELVQESVHLIDCQQRGLLFGRRGEVHHQAHPRTYIVSIGIHMLVTELCHPSTAAFRAARVEIQVENRHELFAAIDLIHLSIRVIWLNFLRFFEAQVIQGGSQSENPINHLIQRKIDFKFLCFKTEFLLLEFFHIVTQIPTLEGVVEALLLSKLLQVFYFPLCNGQGGGFQLI